MYDFEKTDIGLLYQKNKEMQLRRLEVFIKSQAMPTVYLKLIYHFLIGSLWIRYSPIFPAIHDCVSAIIMHSSMDQREYFV